MKKPFLVFFAVLIGVCGSLSGCGSSMDDPYQGKPVMLITDKEVIEDSLMAKDRLKTDRQWFGIPGIERTPSGRLYSTYLTGGTVEPQIGNYSVLLISDDDGDTWQPIAIVYIENVCVANPVLWIDPTGKLWFFSTITAEGNISMSITCASICEFPDQPSPVFAPPRIIAPGVMMNKPTVTSDSRWLFSIYVLDWFNVTVPGFESGRNDYAYVYESIDQGKTFGIIGYADTSDRNFDEHMILEKNDGSLNMYIRTLYGIGLSTSSDGGRTWTSVVDSGIPSPISRFHIRRLRSGKVLMINHHNFVGRSHMTAMLSDDDGLTWPHTLLLDERVGVSYPDAVETEDGFLYITYDFLRWEPGKRILMAKITEEDILAGSLVNNNVSYLRKVIQGE